MQRLRLMHDWHCWPLWSDDPVGNVDPESLPIAAELSARLNRWAATYDSFLNMDDPTLTSIDAASLESLKREVLDLWIALRTALPSSDFHIEFQWGAARYNEPDELPADWMVS